MFFHYQFTGAQPSKRASTSLNGFEIAVAVFSRLFVTFGSVTERKRHFFELRAFSKIDSGIATATIWLEIGYSLRILRPHQMRLLDKTSLVELQSYGVDFFL